MFDLPPNGRGRNLHLPPVSAPPALRRGGGGGGAGPPRHYDGDPRVAKGIVNRPGEDAMTGTTAGARDGAPGAGAIDGRPASPWAPLANPLFRALWIAALASNVGTWMQDVGGTWLMTTLTTSPILIALEQTATTFPVFLLALIAGALADVVDRRRLLMITQTWMLFASAALGVLTLLGLTSIWVLLALTFLLGLGAALNAPAWQAIIPELVGRSELPSALALNGIAINLARALGPAPRGLIVAAAGPAGGLFPITAAVAQRRRHTHPR